MSESFRSKHAGRPGSLMALRVDYPLTSSAFESLDAGDSRTIRRSEIKKFTSGLRIGEKADWNASIVDELHPFPSHSPQRTLSEFQGVKLEYNFRASALPMVNKQSIFVRKPNKMQMDASLFLTKSEKERLVPQCPGTTASLSRHELQNHTGTDLERAWNCSIQLPDERASVFKLPSYELRHEKNKKKKILDPERHTTLRQRFEANVESIRESKLSSRSEFLARSKAPLSSDGTTSMQWSEGGTIVVAGAPKVFKMSNRSEWMDKVPIELPPSTEPLASTQVPAERGDSPV